MKTYDVEASRLYEVNKHFLPRGFNEDEKQRADMIRKSAAELAVLILRHTPRSREQSLALTKIDEAAMHAVSAIARWE